MTNRSYLGLATTPHDSAIAVVDEGGNIVFAEATERYLQSKRAINTPPDVPYYTRRVLGEFCDPSGEIVVAFSWSGQRDSQHRSLLASIDASESALKRAFGRIPEYVEAEMISGRYLLHSNIGMELLSGYALEYELAQLPSWQGARIEQRRYDHHLTHAVAACMTSPFEEAACAVLDGYGEDSSYAFYTYEQGRVRPVGGARLGNPSSAVSLGQFYERICQACGFDSASGEEWKVMGLAAYGEHDPVLYALFRSMVKVEGLHLAPVDDRQKWIHWRELHRIRRKHGDPALTAANLACTAQQVFAETLYELLSNLHAETRSDNLVLGGGCALNSSANGGILEHTPFRNLHVFCAPADDGNAVGAALLAWQQDHPYERVQPRFQSPYLGSEMSSETLRKVKAFGRIEKLTECSGDAPERAAKLLSQGKIIGWIQGRAEFGPRALGNRSILADPRSAVMKEEINARVKFREEFRPFAPSILHEFGPQYFVNYQAAPYMERTLRFQTQVLHRVPAVVHADRTGRLQTVKREWNERYHRLIRRFYELTDVPLVLNTSFNVMGKPIAHSIEDVLAVFFTSGLDAVFIGDTLIEK